MRQRSLLSASLAAVCQWRLWSLVAMMVIAGFVSQRSEFILPAMAQDSSDLTDEPVGPSPKQSTAAAIKQRTWIDTLKNGGVVGGVIILLSLVATGLVVEHALTIRKSRIMPEPVIQELEQLIAQYKIQNAIDYAADAKNASLATDIVLAGLERYQSSEFGFAEYKSACEEAGEEATAKLYRKIDMLNLIGVIAPMLGLLGTVQGMIDAFNTIASKEGAARPHELADSISLALITTFEGLVVAIPAMVAYSFFRNRIDSLVSEAGSRIERIMLPLSRRRTPSVTPPR